MHISMEPSVTKTVCTAAVAAFMIVLPPVFAASATDGTIISGFASPKDPPVFDTPENAVDAFTKALAQDDFDGAVELLGIEPVKARAGEGVLETYGQIREGAQKKIAVRDVNGSRIIDIGDRLWPLPFPIVKGSDGKWAFDTYAGFEEIINRRVGENELQAIETLRAYVDAQNEYASSDRDGDGVIEYARKLISSDGKMDGLYWSPDLEAGESPAGDAFDNDAVLNNVKSGAGYYGYHFRIVESQGPNIAGGQFDYVINDNMIAGFALVAWPVRYGETGVHTFEINANGTIYQADLGKDTERMAAGIKRFNPDDNWEITQD